MMTNDFWAGNYMNKAYEISIIRIVSTFLIIICHIQSHYGYGICEWFNVGVQVFFFMSGYLLGTNTNKNSEWLLRRMRRLFVDYWIFIIVIVLLYCFITPENLSVRTIIHLLCGKDVMKTKGLGHLWFVRPMALCYLQVFFMEYLVNNLQNSKPINKVIGGGIVLILLAGFSVEIDYHWLIVFTSGYIIRKLFNTEIYHLIISSVTGMITMILSYLRILDPLNNSIKIWWHVFAGIFIFMFLYYLLKRINIKMSKKVKTFLNFTDIYTYDIYITHAIFITGYFSVLEITPYIVGNFFILFVIILFSAYVLYLVVKVVNKEIDKVFARINV